MVGTTSQSRLPLVSSCCRLAETTLVDSCPAVLGRPTAIATTEEGLAAYLTQDIFPQLAPPPYAAIEVTVLSERKPVFLFHEVFRDIQVVGKLFARDNTAPQEAWMAAEREYFNLRMLRGRYGMGSGVCRVVAPLGATRELGALLITERASGAVLDHFIGKAACGEESEELFESLGLLARFFARLHQNSQSRRGISPGLLQWYLWSLTDSLSEDCVPASDLNEIEECGRAWAGRSDRFEGDSEVIVHGDATPTNFLFGDHEVTGIDLERMKWADRCWDLGFMAAELKHHFLWRSGDGWAAEPFIGHFLWEYAAHCGDGQFFQATTRRLPGYMAVGLLRIARNRWLGEAYRRGLVKEAKRCLQYGP
jgi:hypothetical protein